MYLKSNPMKNEGSVNSSKFEWGRLIERGGDCDLTLNVDRIIRSTDPSLWELKIRASYDTVHTGTATLCPWWSVPSLKFTRALAGDSYSQNRPGGWTPLGLQYIGSMYMIRGSRGTEGGHWAWTFRSQWLKWKLIKNSPGIGKAYFTWLDLCMLVHAWRAWLGREVQIKSRLYHHSPPSNWGKGVDCELKKSLRSPDHEKQIKAKG